MFSMRKVTCVELKPASFEPGEPMVRYVTDSADVSIPERSVLCFPGCFFSEQLRAGMADVAHHAVRLTSPVFQDAVILKVVLDFLNRRLDQPATLRRADLKLDAGQWRRLNEAEMFVFRFRDRNPFWSGLCGCDFEVDGDVSLFTADVLFDVGVSPAGVVVCGSNGFYLRVDMALDEGVSGLAIACTIDGRNVECRGVLKASGHLRVRAVDRANYPWFICDVRPKRPPNCALVYGD